MEGQVGGVVAEPIANPLLEAITDLVNLLLSGEVPQFVRASLFGGSITALAQEGGGVRPIAVGYTWRRLAGKGGVSACVCSPRCSPAGAEAAWLWGHGWHGSGCPCVSTGMSRTACRRVHVFVKAIDFTNAFNYPAA